MKAYIVRGDRGVINPVNETLGNCLTGNEVLTSLQKGIFQKSEIEPVFVENENQIKDQNEHVVVGDNVYFTEDLFTEFLARSRQQKKNTIYSLKKWVITLRTMSNIQDAKYNEDCINP